MRIPSTIDYLIPSPTRRRLAERSFDDVRVSPLVRIEDPTGIACWLVAAIDGDRLFCLGDLGLGSPEPMVVGHAFLSAMHGPTGVRLRCTPQFDRRWTMDVWTRVAKRTGSIVAAEIELFHAGEALALSRCAAVDAQR